MALCLPKNNFRMTLNIRTRYYRLSLRCARCSFALASCLLVIVLTSSSLLQEQAEANSDEHNYQHGDREHFESQPVFTWPSQILVVFVSLVQGIDGLAVDLLVGKLLSHVRD